MKKLITFVLCALMVSFFMPPGTALAAPLVNIGAAPATVSKYDKLEVPFTISGVDYNAVNPFNPNLAGAGTANAYQKPGIKADGYFRKTGAADWTIQPAFYDGNSNWKVRFSAKETGNWEYKIKAELASGVNESAVKTFTVTDSANHGFLQVNPKDARLFQFEDGTAFNPIGTAISGISVDRLAALDAMKQNGMNFTRVFMNTATQIEVMGTDTTAAKCSDLNNYNLSRAASVDAIFDRAHQDGVYIQWVQEDWEKLKNRTTATENTYIACGSSVASDAAGFFSNATAKEIYERKLRYIAARWGYSTNLMAVELINELGGASGDKAWHVAMGDYYHNITPYSKHMITSSNGSEELRLGGGIPWDQPQMDYVNYHSYGKCTNPWDYPKFDTKLETLGSTEGRPWYDTSVWADRVVRAFRGNSWGNKPLVWGEFGMGMSDWNALYTADTAGIEIKDSIWASALNGYVINNWKYDYATGYGIYPPSKLPVYKALSNYLKDINFTGMKQETTYPVADSRNASPNIVSSKGNVTAYGMSSADEAYIYVKNATTPFAQVSPAQINTCTSNTVPTAASQAGDITVKNLTPGAYSLTKWSTTETDPVKQILETKSVTVGADGSTTIAVSLGTTTGTSDYAYKITPVADPGSIKILSSYDKTSVLAGDSVNVTNKITNSTINSAAGLTVTDVLPDHTDFVSASDGGTVGIKSISCDQASKYGRPVCTGSFNAPAVTWTGVSVASKSDKSLTAALKVTGATPPPPIDTSYIPLTGATPLPVEAEDSRAVITAPMVVYSSTSASGGKYIDIPDNTAASGGSAVYNVDATNSPGTYYFWASVWWTDTSGNSFTVQNDSEAGVILTDDTYQKSHWIKLGSNLSLTGKHTLSILRREDGSQIDRFVLTTDAAYDPNGVTPPPADTTLPKVTITSPSDGAMAKIRSTQTITAAATDNVGVTKVEFYINGTLKTTQTTSPYSMSWSTKGYSAGSYNITVRAYDKAGNIGQSQVNITLRR